MRALVTGAAGFIGSTLSEALVARGDEVVGLDCFSDYYDPSVKRANLRRLLAASAFRLVEDDLLRANLPALLRQADVVFHLAAQAGVRASWGDDFAIYTNSNILATQRLLEAARAVPVRRLVYASSSSVYGEVANPPAREDLRPQPVSPYGVSKLAAEHLCVLYHRNFGVPTVSLRYFTVYGPRQRPDMGFHKFIRAILEDLEITVYGDGEQKRDATYVDDVVQATLAAAETDAVGQVFNVGGGSQVTVNQVIRYVEEFAGRRARVRHVEAQHGDVRDTQADIGAARRVLGFAPTCSPREGLRREYAWLADLLGTTAGRGTREA